jgi:hypothetical protein
MCVCARVHLCARPLQKRVSSDMATVDDEDEALYGGGTAVGEATEGDVGLGGDTAVAEEAALEDEAAPAKAGEGAEGGGEEGSDDEDDGVDVIIDQEDLQTPGRPGGAGMWGGAALVFVPKLSSGSHCPLLFSRSSQRA